ncbi:DsbE family thiol:disulfide interchange protein [Pseudohoeflea sp. DP4N28-3]|uniref:DsbE family thiol:disulfide interchange protein n=2 Tax=Pseudohoeflea coraliihabitans TaxID=2860393 RepID=A0ABS6WL95_9HYPH|nr:DsbE family thiol:disulfide interchange protein [Pseudohoeflea sp. DP4N28-3]MBW3096728.1 DsbE family thiol:disulfide interchange protein [Pseudohoeflea sp. DP4N28-3]
MHAGKPAETVDSRQERGGRSRRLLAFLPLLIFAALAAVFLLQLQSGKDASEVPSVLIGTQAPSLDLEPLDGLMADGSQVPGLSDAAIAGRLALVNVFASWCVPCRQEHPLLMQLSADERVTVVGINYKDQPENALRFLRELGNPYDAVGVDPRGQSSIDWGVYGIPETYLVAPDGTILFKQIGPFTVAKIENELLPLIAEQAALIDPRE